MFSLRTLALLALLLLSDLYCNASRNSRVLIHEGAVVDRSSGNNGRYVRQNCIRANAGGHLKMRAGSLHTGIDSYVSLLLDGMK